MLELKVRKLFQKTFSPCAAAAPSHPKTRPTFKPRLEVLEGRFAPGVGLFWDPTNGSNASTAANWDIGSLGSHSHPTAAPGNTAGESDVIFCSGQSGQGGNKSCT